MDLSQQKEEALEIDSLLRLWSDPQYRPLKYGLVISEIAVCNLHLNVKFDSKVSWIHSKQSLNLKAAEQAGWWTKHLTDVPESVFDTIKFCMLLCLVSHYVWFLTMLVAMFCFCYVLFLLCFIFTMFYFYYVLFLICFIFNMFYFYYVFLLLCFVCFNV